MAGSGVLIGVSTVAWAVVWREGASHMIRASKVTVTDGGPPFYRSPLPFGKSGRLGLRTAAPAELIDRGRGSRRRSLLDPLRPSLHTAVGTLGSFGEPTRWRFVRVAAGLLEAFVGCLLCLHASVGRLGDS